MEYGKRDELKSVYTYGLNRISVETIADTYNPALDEFETDYYLYDGRGSVANVLTDSSEIVASYSYDPFGNITKGASAFDCFYGYNAEETNPVTGLQYLRARYYDTETGRFGTADTYLGVVTDPLTLNRYAYTVNNPVMQIDPSGHWPKWLDKAANKVKSAVKTVATGVKKAAKATANFVQENAAVIGAAVGIAAAAVVMVVTAPVSVPAMLGTLAVSAGVALVCAGVGGTVQTNYEAKKQSKKVDAYVEECNDIVKEEEKLEAEIRAVVENKTPISQAKRNEILDRAAVIEQRKIEAEVKRKHLCEEGERLQKQADLYQNITYAGVGLTAMGFAPLSGPAIATTATGSSVLASMPAIGSASVSQIATGLAYTAGATEVLYAGSNIMELETGNNPIKETFYDGDDAAYEKDLETLNKINVASTLVGAASAVSSGITNYQNAKSQNSGSQNTTPQGTSSGSAGTSGTSRPTWRQSENDVGDLNPSYESQKSFINGQEVPYGTKGSSRPDFYTAGSSIEVKNYDVTTNSGRNSLINTVSNQVNKRIVDLPSGTQQTIVIDVREQSVANDALRQIRDSILEKSNIDVIVQFMR